MTSRIIRLSKIFKHKYEFVKSAAEIDYDLYKKKAESEIIDHINKLSDLIRKSNEFRDLAFRFANDPNIEFSQEAKNTIELCQGIASIINFLDKEKNNLNLEKMAHPILTLSDIIQEFLLKHGEDRWGLSRDKYLPLINLYSEIFTTQGAYKDRTVLDPMAKREMDRAYGRITHLFDSISNHLKNRQNNGILDILKSLSKHGMIDNINVEKSIDKYKTHNLQETERVPATAADHELRQVMTTFMDQLGLVDKGLNPQDIMTWKKYLPDSAEYTGNSKELSSTLGRKIFRGLIVSKEYTPGMFIPGDYQVVTWLVQGLPKQKVVGPSLLDRVEVLADRLNHQYKLLKKKELEQKEKMFGSDLSREVIEHNVPFNKIMNPSPVSSNLYREYITYDLSDNDRELWTENVPKEVKNKVQNIKDPRELELTIENILKDMKTHSSESDEIDFSKYL